MSADEQAATAPPANTGRLRATSLAIQLGRDRDVTLCGFARAGRLTV